MPERLDRITVALSSGDVTLSWDCKEALMARLQHVQETAKIRSSFFEAVGAPRPVELSHGQRTALLLVLETWSLDGDGYEPMPQGLSEFRNALCRDMRSAEQ